MARYDSLVEIYREAQLRLIKIITGHTGAGTKTYYNTVLKQVEALMNQLQAETGRYISTAIPAEYEEALNETYDYFKRNNLMMKRPDMFAQIHADAVHDLAREMQFHITEGLSQAGRRVMRYLDTSRDNALRQHGLKASAVKIASGQTVKDMQKDLIQRLSQEGFFTVQYGAGKGAYQVGLDAYAAMVARSTTREAGNLARENQLIDNGYDLMIMTEHYPTCGLCATLQGRVYSISGRDKRFPPLSRAFSSGYRNVHPNCRHVMTYWVESMQSPQELREAITKSNAPFTDIRSADEKALYSKQQADSRKMRADRSQFERYRARLGSEAPKTFTQFRKLKKQGGEKWEELQKLYRSKFPKTVDNSGGSGIIELNRKFDRKQANIGAFAILEIPMQKKQVLSICKKYSIDTTGITFKIQRSEKFLALPFYGSTDYNNIGRIDLFPKAFSNEEELVKTILHEKCHVKQLKKYGKKYTQDNLDKMEKQAYRFESIYYNIITKRRQ